MGRCARPVKELYAQNREGFVEERASAGLLASSIEEKALAVVLVDGRLEEETRACSVVVGILLRAGVFCDANARDFQEDIMMKAATCNWTRPRMKR